MYVCLIVRDTCWAVASCKGEGGLGKNSVASLQLTELNFFSCDRTLIELLVNIFSLKLPF